MFGFLIWQVKTIIMWTQNLISKKEKLFRDTFMNFLRLTYSLQMWTKMSNRKYLVSNQVTTMLNIFQKYALSFRLSLTLILWTKIDNLQLIISFLLFFMKTNITMCVCVGGSVEESTLCAQKVKNINIVEGIFFLKKKSK